MPAPRLRAGIPQDGGVKLPQNRNPKCLTGARLRRVSSQRFSFGGRRAGQGIEQRPVPVTRMQVRHGDVAAVKFTGVIDGKPFEGGSADRLPLVIGQGRMIAGWEEQLVGMGIGETKQFDVTFPDDYRVEDVRGKQAHFEVELLDLRERLLEAQPAPGEAGAVQCLPEPVAGPGEVVAGRPRVQSRVDPHEEHAQARREDVGDGPPVRACHLFLRRAPRLHAGVDSRQSSSLQEE